jgi:hypothetical protein
MLATICRNIFWVGPIPKVDTSDVSRNSSPDLIRADLVRFVLLWHRSIIAHQIGVPGWVFIEKAIKYKHCWLVKDPFKPISKDVYLLLDCQALNVLEMIKIVLSQLKMLRFYHLSSFIV